MSCDKATLREHEERVLRLEKENFDLKQSLFQTRQRQALLSSSADGARLREDNMQLESQVGELAKENEVTLVQ